MKTNTQFSPTIFSLPRPSCLAIIINGILLLAGGNAVAASKVEEVEFNPAFFPGGVGTDNFDISRFNTGNIILPGTYRTEVYVNGTWLGREELVFKAVEGEPSAQLCIDRAMLIRLGVDIDGVSQKAAQAGDNVPPALPTGAVCEGIGTYVPGASTQFESGEGKLEVLVPQLYLSRKARGYVSPEYWNESATVAFARYNANLYTNSNNGSDSTSNYIGLNTGLNVGDWNFRHNGSYSNSQDASGYQSSATYVQRGLPQLQSQLMGGEIYTSGEFFDSVRLQGVTLATDDRMMPDSMTGFAPIVRGVAETNAKITVRQRGMLLEEVTVPPGPFVLEDLYPTGYGGDLEVTVTEADGRIRQFIVPFASNANLLRPGYQRYSFSLGVMDELSMTSQPWLMQATYQEGLNNLLTGYTGINLSEGYFSQLIGAALNTPIGAVSMDVTTSSADIPDVERMQGQSLQIRYNKNFSETGTNFALGAFRYSTDGFLTAREAAQLREIASEGGDLNDISRLRERFDISLSQNLARGSVFVTGSSQHYWNRPSSAQSYTAGYSGSWGTVNYTLSAQRSRDVQTDRSSDQIDLTFSFPLGSAPSAPTLSTSLSHSDESVSARTGVSGSLGERNQFGYGVSTNYTHSETGNSRGASADLRYRGQYAETSVGYSQGNEYRSANLGMSGGVVAHSGGVTLAPELGDTFGIVHAPGAEGASISGGSARVGADGYAVIPSLVPFRSNSVELDPKGMSHDVELKTASLNVAPRAGSVVLMEFTTSTGRALLINAVQEDGRPLPFGADVYDESGASVGVVGQGSKLFVRTEQDKGNLVVRWGKEAANACTIPLQLDAASMESTAHNLPQVSGICKS